VGRRSYIKASAAFPILRSFPRALSFRTRSRFGIESSRGAHLKIFGIRITRERSLEGCMRGKERKRTRPSCADTNNHAILQRSALSLRLLESAVPSQRVVRRIRLNMLEPNIRIVFSHLWRFLIFKNQLVSPAMFYTQFHVAKFLMYCAYIQGVSY